jgi:hypothetical protein
MKERVMTKLNWRNQVWVLKNSFQGVSTTEVRRKLLNVRSQQALKIVGITVLVLFSTATPDCNSWLRSEGRLTGPMFYTKWSVSVTRRLIGPVFLYQALS